MDSYRKFSGKMLDGRYRIEEPVGIGGMAVVFSAIDTLTGRRVAVKMLRESVMNDRATVKRFINESRAVASFNHNNIVRIYDVSVDGPCKYIVMEYIDGMTLREYMDYKRPLDWRDALIYVDQVLRALDHSHHKGIIHRDIKPQNIMLLEGGYVKVMDFGIAKMPNSESLTVDKAIGTVYYISPEQARGGKIDSRSDIYSLGVMLYEMVTGKLPFTAETPYAVVMKQVNDTPTPPSQLNPKIPLGLEQIILCAMQKKAENRYQSASQMLRHIRQLENDPTLVFVMRQPSPKTPTADVAIERTKKTDIQSSSYYTGEVGEERPVTPTPSEQQAQVGQQGAERRPYRQPAPAQQYGQHVRQQQHSQPIRQQHAQPIRQQQYGQPTRQAQQQYGQPARQAQPQYRQPQRPTSYNQPYPRHPVGLSEADAEIQRRRLQAAKAAQAQKQRPRGSQQDDTVSLLTVILIFLIFLALAIACLLLIFTLFSDYSVKTDVISSALAQDVAPNPSLLEEITRYFRI